MGSRRPACPGSLSFAPFFWRKERGSRPEPIPPTGAQSSTGAKPNPLWSRLNSWSLVYLLAAFVKTGQNGNVHKYKEIKRGNMKIPAKVTQRLKEEVPRFQKILTEARSRDVNEADTVVIITDMLERVFGMDKYTEVTREHAIKGTFVDLAVKTDGKIQYLIEVKAVGLDLRENHLRQVVDYAAKEGVRWAVLTNGVDWEIHRVTVAGHVANEEVIKFNFLELSPRRQEDLDTLFLLCRKGIEKELIEEYYDRQQACNRFVIGALLGGEAVASLVRRQLRSITPALRVSAEEIQTIIRDEVIKRDVRESEQGLNAQKRVARELAKLERKKAKTR